MKSTKNSIKRLKRIRGVLATMRDTKGLYDLLRYGEKTVALLNAAFGRGRWGLEVEPVRYWSAYPAGGAGGYSGAATVSCPSVETMRDFLQAVGREDGVEYAFSKYARKVIVQWGKLRIRAIYES